MQKKRNGAIDFWRFVFSAALVVFHSHVLNIYGKYDDASFPMHMGSLAVEFFLLTSGFLFAKSMNKRSELDFSWSGIWSFIKGKLMSFYPAFVICWALTFAVSASLNYSGLRDLAARFGRGVFELTLLRNAGFDVKRVLPQAWYLSAMMLAMLLLYPIYAKNKRRFEHYIAPIVAALLLGYLCHTYGSIINPSMHLEYTYKGNLRVLAEICLGVVCYDFWLMMKDKEFSVFGRIVLAAAELFGYLFSLFFMQFYGHFPVYFHYIVLILLAVSVTITFSEKSLISPLFNRRVFTVLGRYSLYPYLLYALFAYNLPKIFPEMSKGSLIALYLVLTFAFSAVVMAVHELCSRAWKRRRQRRAAMREVSGNG